ncbi:hypothetical protein A1O1_05526 [Capronia coronata CBS 617.96]|uniref:HPP transmembrane region domain-containing protein n=1 Tax=Capronia coronata CBS 617.96 TaxID=1182541 RepID=W9YH51_9EURO|nr:uncharacterized protein A1O1_05526 [Capronia coronata CBS 617.96]EXJ88596.1 hypothetical protein A1O1_05526 [Capronia coronata CBS 617.96]
MSSKYPRKAQPESQPSKPTLPFDIDNYLNPYVPRNPLYLLPAWISYWFGYRPPLKDAGGPSDRRCRHHYFQTITVWCSVFVGAFCGLAIIENVFLALPPLSGHEVPIIIASFGAAAILEYNTIESPLSQPRNLVLGHFLSAIVAVGITKLFALLPSARFDELRWLAGALAVGAASVVMSITKTVHPPAGATALLAATNVEIQHLGWWLLPLVLLAASLMLASALVLNNVAGRRFPIYWWTPIDLKALREERLERRPQAAFMDTDPEKAMESQSISPSTTSSRRKESGISDADTEAGSQEIGDGGHDEDLRKTGTRSTRLTHTASCSSAGRILHRPFSESAETLDRQLSATTSPAVAAIDGRMAGQRSQSRNRSKNQVESQTGQIDRLKDRSGENTRIIITRDQLIAPDWLQLNDYEDEILRILRERLKDG